MKTRNLILAMVLSSVMGGAIAIVGYSWFAPQPQNPAGTPVNYNPGLPVSFTNYVADTTSIAIAGGLNFVGAAQEATPSVVHIRTTYDGSTASRAESPFEDFFRDYFDQAPRRGNGRQSRGSGSGVIFTDDGFIVTNNHVVDGASEIEVLLTDNRSYPARIVGTDPNTDLAVIRIQADNLNPIAWGNSDETQIGEWVLAVGNPYEFRSTVTAGIVSAKARSIDILRTRSQSRLAIESFIQTDAAVNPGNSGGALVNLRGELVGINTAIASPTGSFAGYSFAVPVTLVRKVAADLVEFGAVQRALLGVSIRDVNQQLSEQEELSVVQGIYIQEVQSNSAAAESGIEAGDVITNINGRQVNSVSELQEQVALNRPGDDIDVTYIRDGRAKTVRATLKNSYGTMETVEVADNSYSKEGATFADISGEEREALGISGGVKILELESGVWREAGIREGFVITRIDKVDINTVDDLRRSIERPRGEGMLIEGYYGNGEKAFYGIGW
ncbi:MAG: Do family serine endopeptidase [Bacteroidota bacterium]